MRSTIIAPNAWAADSLRFETARLGRIGVRVLPLEFAVARLAGGLQEMAWHLVRWGNAVTIVKPARLRRLLADMGASLAAHHGPTGKRSSKTSR